MRVVAYDDPIERARRAVAAPGLQVIDLAVGVFGAVLPSCSGPVFLRLAPPVGGPIDDARATYLLLANVHLCAGTGGWVEGPGIASLSGAARAGGGMAASAGSPDALRAEVESIASAIHLLGEDERFARAYLEIHAGVATAVDGAASQAGISPDLSPTATQTKRRG